VNDESKQRVLVAGAHAYAQAFSRVPPGTRRELESQLDLDDELATEVKNAVTAALRRTRTTTSWRRFAGRW
jgi:hypothetical protein